MSKAARFFGIAILFGILGVIFLLTVPAYPVYLLYLSLFFGVVGVSVALLDDRAAFVSLGASLCVLPLFGHGILNLFVLGWLGGVYFLRSLFGFPYAHIDLSGSREIASWAFFLLVLPMLCAVGLTLSAEFDWLLLQRLVQSEGLSALFRYLASADVAWLRALNVMAGGITAGLLFFAVLSVSNVTQNFLHLAWGIAIGIIFASLFLVGQLLELHPFFFININPFWHFVGRYPASFSDPNAFGIMAMLILPIFLVCATGKRAAFFSVLAVFFFAFSIWSGSRSLYLGLAIWVPIFLSFLIRNTGRKELQVALWSGALLFVTMIVMLGYPPVNSKLQSVLNFPSTTRVLKTINWSEAGQQLQSRQAYSKVAYHAWRRSPLTGLGLERFYGEQQRIMKTLNLDLGGWRDNANNFYLQVLAEQGALGLGMMIVALTLFAFALLSPQRKAIVDLEKIEPAAVQRIFFLARSLMLVIFIVLITGPHLLFDEVRYLTFFLLALALSRPILVRHELLRVINALGVLSVLVFPALFFVSVSRGISKTYTVGFYPVESAGGVEFAWMGSKARLNVCSVGGTSTVIRLRALHPDISRTPVRVALFERNIDDTGPLDLTKVQPAKIVLNDTEWHDVTVPLPNGGYRARDVIEIRVNRTWSPRKLAQGDDARALGVMIRWPAEGC